MVVSALVNPEHRLHGDRTVLVVAGTSLDQHSTGPCRGGLVAAVSGDRARGLSLRRTPALTNDTPTDVRLKRVDQALFDRVAAMALEQPRLRKNHNLHQEIDLVQRFLNVLQPGTYVRPHRHVRPESGTGFECFLVLQGAIGLLVMDGSGAIVQQERLEAKGPLRGIELAENQFHTLVALEADTVMFELKQGPYQPTEDKDFLRSFPLEGCEEARLQEKRWRERFD